MESAPRRTALGRHSGDVGRTESIAGVAATAYLAAPLEVAQVPVDGLCESAFEIEFALPVQVALRLGAANCVAEVMSGAV